MISALQQRARDRQRELGIRLDPLGGQPLDQRLQRADVAADQQVDPPLAGQPGRQVPRLRLDRVEQAACLVAVIGEPRRGAPVQAGDLLGGLAAQLGREQLPEQRVVAIPLAAPVQRREQRTAAGERAQPEVPVAAAGQRVGEIAVEQARDRRAQQEAAVLG